MKQIENEVKRSTADYWVDPSNNKDIEYRINDLNDIY